MSVPALPLPLAGAAHPTDEAGLARAIAEAAGSATPIYPIGGGVGLGYGVAPRRAGIGLSLAKLNRIVDYPARDLTITVEAGLTFAELTARLATQRQRLPVDIPLPGRATIGGAIAVAASGPRRCAYGTLRDYLLGFRAVDGRGTPFAGGGRVVKNAAGYDMSKLIVGSLGTLAVTSQVTLMVRPMPEATALLACPIDDIAAADRLVADLAGGPALPTAVELLAGPAWRADGPARLLVAFEGPQAEVDWMVERTVERWPGFAPLSAAETVTGDPEHPSLWQSLVDFPFDADPAETLAVSLTARPSAVCPLVQALRQADGRLSLVAHAASGVLRAEIRLSAADEAGPLVTRVLRPAAAAAGANLVVLFAPDAAALNAEQVWGPAPEGVAVMNAIKQQFDPAGILNPGRFIFPAGKA